MWMLSAANDSLYSRRSLLGTIKCFIYIICCFFCFHPMHFHIVIPIRMKCTILLYLNKNTQFWKEIFRKTFNGFNSLSSGSSGNRNEPNTLKYTIVNKPSVELTLMRYCAVASNRHTQICFGNKQNIHMHVIFHSDICAQTHAGCSILKHIRRDRWPSLISYIEYTAIQIIERKKIWLTILRYRWIVKRKRPQETNWRRSPKT